MKKAMIIGWLLMIVAIMYLILVREISGAVFLFCVGVSVLKSREEELWEQ